MKYENPEIPEGINVTRVHPLKEFALLAGGALLLILFTAFLLGQSVGYLASYLPFEMEQRLAQPFESSNDSQSDMEAYLNTLKGKITAAMDLPEGMEVKLHYSTDDTVNAFATLGGNIILYRGLLEKLPNENALSMLIAHEIAHVKHRDPIVSLSRGIAIQTFISLVFSSSEASILGDSGLYTVLYFSREMERSADKEALKTIQRLYGHTQGAGDLFKVIQSLRTKMGVSEEPAVFRTHPLDQARIDALDAQAAENSWRTEGEIIPIPSSITKQWATSEESPDSQG